MEIDFNKKSSTDASIKVRLNKADYQPQVEKKVADYAKKMNLKGFRPGKVPTGVVRKMYGKSILVDEINHILSHKLQDYIRENNLKILGEPIPNQDEAKSIDWETQEDFEFSYKIGLVDEFALELSKKHKITNYDIQVDKKSLDSTLDDVKKRFGKETEGDKSEIGDTLEINVSNEENGIDKKEVSLSLDKLDASVAKKFTGKKAGDTVAIAIDKLTDDQYLRFDLTGIEPEDAAKLKCELTITINGIKRMIPAEMNQDFFDQVFGAGVVTTEADYIEKVKSTISENYNRESQNFLGLSIRKYFLENVKMELPDSFLKEWLKLTNQEITEEDLEREFSGYAESLKWNLIQNRIAETNNIDVTYDDVKDSAKNMFINQFGGPEAAASIMDKLDDIVENYLKGENGKAYHQIYENVRSEKIISVIKETVTITDKKVSVDEFTKIVEKGA